MTDTLPARRRLGPDERRHQILTHAARLFAERPYAEVSTTDVAQAAGVARGLINHYFGTKKDLYLEVVRALVTVPPDRMPAPAGRDVAERVDLAVTWFLDVVERLGRVWLAAVNAEGLGRDPDVVRILTEADDDTAARLLATLGLPDSPHGRATLRAWAGMCKAAAHEWVVRGDLTRAQVHDLLTRTLLTVVEGVAP